MLESVVPFDPELHGHLPIARTSERTSYAWCRQQWAWRYIDEIVPKGIHIPFKFGDLVHRALADWYVPGAKRGRHPAKTFEELYNLADNRFNIRDQDTDEWSGAEELGVAVLNHYVDIYGKDNDWIVVSPEMPFQVVLLDKNGKPFVRIVGRMDAVVKSRSTKRLSMLEHKTAAAIRTDHLTLDEQAVTYWTFGTEHLRHIGMLEPEQEVDYVLYNFLRKAQKDKRPQDDQGRYLNKDGSVSKKQPPPYFQRQPILKTPAEAERLITRIRKQMWELEKVRNGDLPIFKSPSYMCPQRCQYFSLCELHEAGADWEEYINLSFTHAEPYEDYNDELDLLRTNNAKKG